MSFRLATRAPLALGATLALVLTVAPAFAAPSTPEPVQHLKISLTASDGSLTKVATSGKTSDGTAAKDLRRQEPEAALQKAPDGEPDAVGDATTAAVLTDVIETPNFVVAGLDWPAGQQFPSDAEVFLRVSERGHWSDWTPVPAEPQNEGERLGTEPFVSGNAEKIQVQVTGAADELPADLRLSILTPGGSQPSLSTATAERRRGHRRHQKATPDARWAFVAQRLGRHRLPTEGHPHLHRLQGRGGAPHRRHQQLHPGRGARDPAWHRRLPHELAGLG